MLWIGLTGGIATGKTSVARLIEQMGYPVLNADDFAHNAIKQGTKGHTDVVQEFGPGVLAKDGEIDRRKLGQLVFGKPDRLEKLELLIHPSVRQVTLEKKQSFEDQGLALAFYDVPLLFEKNMKDQFEKVIVVACSEDLQRVRMRFRDGLTDDEISLRLAAQMPLPEKESLADFVIRNEGSLEELRVEVERVIKALGVE